MKLLRRVARIGSRRVWVATTAAVVLAPAGLAACAEEAPDTAPSTRLGAPASTTSSAAAKPRVPGGSPVAPAGGVLPHSGAPRVSAALPVEVLDRQPCASALTFGQLATVFTVVPEPDERSGVNGTACYWWSTDQPGPKLTVTYAGTGEGLSAIFRAHDTRGSYLRAMPAVRGYPRVAFGSAPIPPDEREECKTAIGIADERVFWVEFEVHHEDEGKVDPCAEATKVAELVLGNLGG